MKNVIIYHEVREGIDCPDGIASAWVAHRAIRDGGKLIPWRYQNGAPSIEPGSNVYIVDFSLPSDVLQGWVDQGCYITLLDHHKTALADLGDFSNAVLRFDMNKCGAVITWEYFYPGLPIPPFLLYVQDHDLWRWELPYSEEVAAAFDIVGRNMDAFDILATMDMDQFLEYMVPRGRLLVEIKRLRTMSVASRHNWIKLGGYTIPCVKLRSDEVPIRSGVCNYLYDQYPEVPFSAAYSVDIVKGIENWSLRSHVTRGIDVTSVSRLYGGGGHRNAAGFSVPASWWSRLRI